MNSWQDCRVSSDGHVVLDYRPLWFILVTQSLRILIVGQHRAGADENVIPNPGMRGYVHVALQLDKAADVHSPVYHSVRADDYLVPNDSILPD